MTKHTRHGTHGQDRCCLRCHILAIAWGEPGNTAGFAQSNFPTGTDLVDQNGARNRSGVPGNITAPFRSGDTHPFEQSRDSL